MSLARTLAVAGRLLFQLLRDKRAMALILVAPLIIMTLLAVLLRTEQNAPKVAIVASGTVSIFLSELETMLESPDDDDAAFEIVDLGEGVDARQAVLDGEVDGVLLFPDAFLEDRADGKRSRLDLVVEGADPMRTAEIFSRFRKAVPDSLSGMPIFLPADCDDHCAETIPDAPPKIELTRVYGDELDEQMDFFIPGMIPFFVFFFVFILSGMTFLRERTSGTAERILASPLNRIELVAGYVIGFLPAAIAQATVIILFARFVLGGPWGGMGAILSVLLMALVSESLGVFVSAFARSEFQVFQFIPIIILPQALLCGLIWPVSGFPFWLKVAAYCMPLTYAVDAARDVAVRGMGLVAVMDDILVLFAFAVVGLVLAGLSIRRTI